VCYLERLAVVPDRRNEGFGRRLVNRALRESEGAGATTMSVGIIENRVLGRDNPPGLNAAVCEALS
jgi:GNAT superfamily N-acetyltransferase